MTVTPSCPALLIHDDDAFRKSLIATLDQKHFTVTVSTDGPDAVKMLQERPFKIVVLGVDLKNKRGLAVLEYLRNNRSTVSGAVIIVGDANPQLRAYAAAAVETLLKPVDASYVAARARVYCGH